MSIPIFLLQTRMLRPRQVKQLPHIPSLGHYLGLSFSQKQTMKDSSTSSFFRKQFWEASLTRGEDVPGKAGSRESVYHEAGQHCGQLGFNPAREAACVPHGVPLGGTRNCSVFPQLNLCRWLAAAFRSANCQHLQLALPVGSTRSCNQEMSLQAELQM